MKITIITAMTMLLSGYSIAQSSGYSLTEINNNSVSTDSLNGKKVLIMVLSLQTDTSEVNQLLRFQTMYAQTVKVIAMVSPQSVTTQPATTQSVTASVDSTASPYQSMLNAGIIVTEGLQSIDSAAGERESVLKWITDKNMNRQAEPFAAGSKYFLSETGRLYANLGKKSSLDDRLIKSILNTTLPQRFFNSQPKDTTTPVIKTDSTQQHL